MAIKRGSKGGSYKALKEIYNICISKHMSGKMSGVWGISTSCCCNRICQARAKDPTSICSKCYAARYQAVRPNVRKAYELNFETLTTTLIPADCWPVFGREIFRIEAFGDLANWIQAANYITMATVNPLTVFGWWTKNPEFIKQAVDRGYKIPKNVIIIYSNDKVDKPLTATEKAALKAKYPFIRKFFNVITKLFAKKNRIKINCGARSCDKCRRCYKFRTTEDIIELLK